MPSGAGQRILAVDDDEAITVLLRHVLESEGYVCATAGDLAAASELLRSEAFDLLLCDVHLPDGSGLDLLEEIRLGDQGMAALIVSGLDDVAVGDRALRLGAYGYIVKPFSANDVLIGVLGALGQRERAMTARQAIRDASAETIQRLCVAVEARDRGTAAHIDAMSEHCFAIARELGLSRDRCELLHAASPMHDVGKVGVPDQVLLKPGPLTDEEREVMRSTPRSGTGSWPGPVPSCCASPRPSRGRTTSGSTARATRAAWPATRSRSRAASPPSPTCSTRSHGIASTARGSRPIGPWA